MLRRRNLRADVRDELLRQITRGRLPAGSNLNEQALAEQLGVSRTPLREALLSLEAEGLLEARPGRGWFVTELTVETVNDVYPMISALECLALRSADPGELAGQLPELRRLNTAMAEAADAAACQRLDDRWHTALLAACPNQTLRQLVASLKRLVHRYEFAYLSDGGSAPASVREHDDIIEAIERGDYAGAEAALDRNWRHGADVLATWLGDR